MSRFDQCYSAEVREFALTMNGRNCSLDATGESRMTQQLNYTRRIMALIGLTYGERIEIGWAGKNHDQLMLRTYTDDTTVQIAASYDGNRHNHVPELIETLQKFQDQDPTTPGRIE